MDIYKKKYLKYKKKYLNLKLLYNMDGGMSWFLKSKVQNFSDDIIPGAVINNEKSSTLPRGKIRSTTNSSINKQKLKLKPHKINTLNTYDFENKILYYVVNLYNNIVNDTFNLCTKTFFFIQNCPLDNLIKEFIEIKNTNNNIFFYVKKIFKYLYASNHQNSKFNYIMVKFLTFIITSNNNILNYYNFSNHINKAKKNYDTNTHKHYTYIFQQSLLLDENEVTNIDNDSKIIIFEYHYIITLLDLMEQIDIIFKNDDKTTYIYCQRPISNYIQNIINKFKNKSTSIYIKLFTFLQSYLFDYNKQNNDNNIYIAHLYSYLSVIMALKIDMQTIDIQTIDVMLDAYYNYFYRDKHINDVVPNTTVLTDTNVLTDTTVLTDTIVLTDTTVLTPNINCNIDNYFEYFNNNNNTYENMNKILNIIIKIINILKITNYQDNSSTNSAKINIQKQIEFLEAELTNTNTMCNLIYCLRCIYFNKDKIYDNMKFFSFMYMFINLYHRHNTKGRIYMITKQMYLTNLLNSNFSTNMSTSVTSTFYDNKLLKPHNNSKTIDSASKPPIVSRNNPLYTYND